MKTWRMVLSIVAMVIGMQVMAADSAVANTPSELSAVKGMENLPEERMRWKRPMKDCVIHFTKAMEAAKRQHKYVLVLKTGFDWCAYCSRVKKGVFDTRYFQQLARQSFVVLCLDESRRNQNPPDQQQHNELVMEKLNIVDKPCPYAVILDAEGKVLSAFDGNLEREDFLAQMERISNPPRETDDSERAKRPGAPIPVQIK